MDSASGVDGLQEMRPRWLTLGSLNTAGGVFVGLNALYVLLVAFGNLTDFATNQAFVHHVLSMDTTNFGLPEGRALDPVVMWHAIESRPLQNAAYVALIAWESLAGVVLAVATVSWFARSGRHRATARAVATIGLMMTVLLFVGGFLDVGGEWFQMWRSPHWNGSEVAFRNAVLAILTLLVIHHPGRSGSG